MIYRSMKPSPVTLEGTLEASGLPVWGDWTLHDLLNSPRPFDASRYSAAGTSLIPSDGRADMYAVRNAIKDSGRHPATVEQLIAWHIAHPDDSRTIVALGTHLPDPINWQFPRLATKKRWFRKDLRVLGKTWLNIDDPCPEHWFFLTSDQ